MRHMSHKDADTWERMNAAVEPTSSPARIALTELADEYERALHKATTQTDRAHYLATLDSICAELRSIREGAL